MEIVKSPWAVHIKERDETGLPPYIYFDTSAERLSYLWFRRFGEIPIKINPAHFDAEIGTYIEEIP